jgi:hypothetical protein
MNGREEKGVQQGQSIPFLGVASTRKRKRQSEHERPPERKEIDGDQQCRKTTRLW